MRTLLLLPLLVALLRAEEEPKVERKLSLGERVNVAIDKGVVWLKQRQDKYGSYGPCIAGSRYESDVESDRDCYRIGPTAFAVFTLRKCGVPRKDKTIKAAVKWLKKRCRRGWNPDHKRVRGTQFQGDDLYRYTSYESSAIIMMLVALNKKEPRRGTKPKPVKLARKPTTPKKGFKKDALNTKNACSPMVRVRSGSWALSWNPTSLR